MYKLRIKSNKKALFFIVKQVDIILSTYFFRFNLLFCFLNHSRYSPPYEPFFS